MSYLICDNKLMAETSLQLEEGAQVQCSYEAINYENQDIKLVNAVTCTVRNANHWSDLFCETATAKQWSILICDIAIAINESEDEFLIQ